MSNYVGILIYGSSALANMLGIGELGDFNQQIVMLNYAGILIYGNSALANRLGIGELGDFNQQRIMSNYADLDVDLKHTNEIYMGVSI